MKKLLIILPLLAACKTSKKASCDAYGAVYVEQDTIVLTTEHINLNDKCSEDTTIITCVTDTFRIPKQR